MKGEGLLVELGRLDRPGGISRSGKLGACPHAADGRGGGRDPRRDGAGAQVTCGEPAIADGKPGISAAYFAAIKFG